jgi:hypothetical protein
MKTSPQEHELKQTREDAKTYTKVGVTTGAGWAALEVAPLVLDGLVQTKQSKGGFIKTAAITAAIVSVGAITYALFKHMRAHDLQEEKDAREKQSWQQRITDKREERSSSSADYSLTL